MENTENKDYVIAEPIQKLLERAQHTNAGLGGYLVYMAILLVLLVVDTIYYEKNVWYDVDYDIYTGLLSFVILLYTTIYLFRGTEGHRIIYGWKRWTLGSVFAIWTLLAALGAWVSVEQTGEEIHSKTGYTRTEMQEIRQAYLDEGYSETDFQAEMIAEIRDNELFSRVLGFLFIASCLGLWYWTESIRKIEEEYQGEEGNVEEEEEQGERRIVLKKDNEEDAESNEEDNEDEEEDEEEDDEEDEEEDEEEEYND